MINIFNLKIIIICCLNLNRWIILFVLNKLNTFERQSLFLFKSNFILSIINFVNFIWTITFWTETYITVARRSTSIASLRSLLHLLMIHLSRTFFIQNFISWSISYLFFIYLYILLLRYMLLWFIKIIRTIILLFLIPRISPLLL